MRSSSKFVQQDICEDSFEIEASAQIDSDLRDALIHPEDGLLKPGAMPRVQASDEGCKVMLKTLGEALSGMGEDSIASYRGPLQAPCFLGLWFL